MSDDIERSVASAGSQPVAWAAWFDGEDKPDGDFTFPTLENASEWCGKRKARPVALFDRKQFSFLTDEEKRAIQVARKCLLPCQDDFDATLGRLLERLG